jgi:integrase
VPNFSKPTSTKAFSANVGTTSTSEKEPVSGVSSNKIPSGIRRGTFIEGGETSLDADMRTTKSHVFKFGLFIEKPKDKESRVYLRMYTRKGKGRVRNERVGVVPNLLVKTRHWHKGGLTPAATDEQHALVEAVRSKLTSLQAELIAKPQHITAANVKALLFPSTRDVWPRLFALAANKPKPKTAERYRYSLLSFKRHCRSGQPTHDLFKSWAKAMEEEGKAARTINSYLGAVRSLCESVDLIFSCKKLRKKEPTNKNGIALSTDELKALLDAPFKSGTADARVRDAFVIACLSSLRSIDWCMFSEENIGKEVVNKKTGKKTPLPDLPLVRQLIERNGGSIELPKRVNAVLRRVSKRVSAACPSLLEEVEVKGESFPRWHLVTSHVGRRTFVSHGFENGLTAAELMRFTGHGSVKQLEAYNASIVSPQEQAASDAAIASKVIRLDLDTPPMKVAK